MGSKLNNVVEVIDMHVGGLNYVVLGAKISQGKVNEHNYWDYVLSGRSSSFGKIMYWLLSSVVHGVPSLDYEGLLEFVHITMFVVAPRYVTHQIVRHRHLSVVQESQRYSDRRIVELGDVCEDLGEEQNRVISEAINLYRKLREQGVPPEQTRKILPECTRSFMMIKTNLREFLHILTLRLTPRAQKEHALLWSQAARMIAHKHSIPIAHLLILKSPQTYELAHKAKLIHSYRDEKWAWLGTMVLSPMTYEQARALYRVIKVRKDLPKRFKNFVEEMLDQLSLKNRYEERVNA